MKTRLFLAAPILFACVLGLPAQQPNDPAHASMVLNGVDGPPFPILGVNFPRGTNQTLLISGLGNQPFVVAGSPTLNVSGIPIGGSLLDIAYSGLSIVFDGLQNGLYVTDTAGQFTAQCPITSATPLGQQRCFQAMVADVTAASGYTLSAATQVTIVVGITTQNFVLGDDAFQNFSFTPFGFTIPYYTQNYSSVFVNSNGSLGFNTGSTDFTPASSTFLGQEPRVAGFWTDLNPSQGGTIQMVVDQTTPVPFIQCNFNNVAEFGSGTPHTFSMRMYAIVGDVIINISGFNPQPLIATLVGISPGGNLGSQPPRDLSTLGFNPGVQGVTNQNFHEVFQASVGWDLAGKILTFTASGAGTPTAAYLATCFP